MPEKKYTYRLLSLLWIFLVIGISSFQTIIPITNDIAIEKNAKKELVIKQHSYEAVMPFFQLDF